MTPAAEAGSGTASHRRRLPGPLAFAGIGYAFGITMLGTTLPTPLYPLYEREHGFGSLMTTIIYAAYAVGVLAALVLIGRASDAIGRRPLLLAGLLASLASALVFVTNPGEPVLIVGRLLSGISAGIFTGTATVTLVELARPSAQRRASILASAINMFGLGCGPLVAGIVAAWLPLPLRLPYLADIVLLVPAFLALWFTPETVRERTGRWPRVQRPGVPQQARAVFIPAAIVGFAAFAVFGLITAIEPTFLGSLLHLHSPALAGGIVFAMFAGSAVGQILLTPLTGKAALPVGCVVLIVGLAAVAAALATESLGLIIGGTIVVGIGQGIAFSAGIAAIGAASPADRRAETVSTYFIVSYIAISIPVVLVGVATTTWGLQAAGIVFAVVMAALTVGALVAVLRLGRNDRDATAGANPRSSGSRPSHR